MGRTTFHAAYYRRSTPQREGLRDFWSEAGQASLPRLGSGVGPSLACGLTLAWCRRVNSPDARSNCGLGNQGQRYGFAAPAPLKFFRLAGHISGWCRENAREPVRCRHRAQRAAVVTATSWNVTQSDLLISVPQETRRWPSAMNYPRRPEPDALVFGRYPAFACRRHHGIVEVIEVAADESGAALQPEWDDRQKRQ